MKSVWWRRSASANERILIGEVMCGVTRPTRTNYSTKQIL